MSTPDTTNNPVPVACQNPYDPDHPEYNTTDPSGMCFVRSGWYSGDTLTTVSGVSSGFGDGDGDMEGACVDVAASSEVLRTGGGMVDVVG